MEGERLVVSTEDGGKILESTGFIGGEIVDLDDGIIAPGFLELQTNGVNGFHFSTLEDDAQYATKLQETGKFYASQGITGFWATIPTTTPDRYQKVDAYLFQEYPNISSKCLLAKTNRSYHS